MDSSLESSLSLSLSHTHTHTYSISLTFYLSVSLLASWVFVNTRLAFEGITGLGEFKRNTRSLHNRGEYLRGGNFVKAVLNKRVDLRD